MSTTTTKPDLDGLRLVVEANKVLPPDSPFDMREWCGTAACLIGNFCKRHPDDRLKTPHDRFTDALLDGAEVLDTFLAIALRFGITELEAEELFSPDASTGNYRDRAPYIARLEQFIRDHESTDPRN